MTNQPADGERPWQFGIVKYVSRDRIANSKDDVLARYRKDAREQVAINVFAELPNDETVMLAVRETMEPDSSTKSVVVRIVADVTRLPHALAAMHKLKAALAAAAESEKKLIEKAAELRDTCCKMVEELAALRKQLSDQAHELGVWQGKAEMWQQRAEIAEREVVRVNERLAAAESVLHEIVCTEPPDDGVVLLSNDSPCHWDAEHNIDVYDHEHFSPLGDALMKLHRTLKGEENVPSQ